MRVLLCWLRFREEGVARGNLHATQQGLTEKSKTFHGSWKYRCGRRPSAQIFMAASMVKNDSTIASMTSSTGCTVLGRRSPYVPMPTLAAATVMDAKIKKLNHTRSVMKYLMRAPPSA